VTSRTRTITAVAALLLLSLLPIPASPQTGAQTTPAASPNTSRVRPCSPEVAALLADGMSRSPTLTRLVAEIEQTDLLVPVEFSSFLPTVGDLRLIGWTSAFRYVRIRLKIPNGRVEMIASLGHELQHAIELAAAFDVRDDAGMGRLYRQIGRHNWGGDRFETRAAQEMGWRVRDELMEHRTPVGLASR